MEKNERLTQIAIHNLREFLLSADETTLAAVWVGGLFFVLFMTFAVPKIVRWIIRKLSPIIHAGSRRKITKAAAALKTNITTYKTELEGYREALKALVETDLSNSKQLLQAFEQFKLSARGLTLSPLGRERFEKILPLTKIHKKDEIYYDVNAKAHGLDAFSVTYKRFYVKVNDDYAEDLDALVASQYHKTEIKPGSDYLMQKNTARDADRAIRYFSKFIHFIDSALEYAHELLQDLDTVEARNGYVRLWMRMD